MEKELKYGHYVNIFGNVKTANAYVNGLLSSKGYINNSVHLQSLPFNLLEDEGANSTLNIKNFGDMVFQIWPKLNYEAHSEHLKLKGQKNLILKKNSRMGADQEGIEERLKMLEARLKEEELSNKTLLVTYFGGNITYGAEVQYFHVDSKMFLKGKIVCSDSDKSAFKFELSEGYSRGMIFKIFSKHKLRQEGEPILYRDKILLFNVKLLSYINFSGEKVANFDIPLPKPKTAVEHLYPVMALRDFPIQSKRFESYLSSSLDCNWRFIYHGPFNVTIEEDDYTQKHTEFDGDLSADIPYKNKNPECWIRNYEGEFEEEKCDVTSIWIVETNDIPKGRRIKLGNPFRLRHYLTSQIMTTIDGTITDKKVLIPCLETSDTVQPTNSNEIFIIPTAIDSTGYLEDGQRYKIMIAKQYLNATSKIRYGEDVSVGGKKTVDNPNAFSKSLTNFKFSSAGEDIYKPLKADEKGILKHGLYCKEEPSDENAFQVLRVEDEEKNDIMFIASSFDILKHFLKIVAEGHKELLIHELMEKVIKTLTELIFFVVKSDNPDPIECEGLCNESRQKLMKDMKLIELTTDILYFPFKNQILDIKDFTTAEPQLIKILQLSYRLIKHVIKEYRPNELYACQWLNLFMKQTLLATGKGGNILAEYTLTELIDNNKKILESKISSNTIDNFIDLLLNQGVHEKYVRLLRALCICDGEAMIKNQAELSRQLLENEVNREHLIYPIRKQPLQQELEIRIDGDWINLETFKNNSMENNKGTTYNYFLSLTNLLADLCLNRNYLAIDVCEEIYPYDVCFNIVSNKKFDPSLRQGFARLILTLFVDRAPFTKINLPNKIRVWGELEENSMSIPSTENDFSKIEGLKAFVIDYLNEVVAKGYQKSYDTDTNLLSQAVLELCKIIFEFGFYRNCEEINVLLPFIFDFLNSTEDVTNEKEEGVLLKRRECANNMSVESAKKKSKYQFFNYEKIVTRYAITEDNLILHRSKEISCEILKTIVKIQDEIKVSQYLSKFKYESTPHEENVNASQSMIMKKMRGFSLFAKGSDPILQDPLQWLKDICEKDQILFAENSKLDMNAVLIDILLYNENPNLLARSFDFLYSTVSQTERLLKMVSEIQILEDDQQRETMKLMNRMIFELSDLAEKSENWLGIESENSIAESERVTNLLFKLGSMMTVGGYISEMRLLEEPDPEGEKKSSDGFDEGDNILLRPGDYPSIFTQRLGANLGLHEIIISILKFDIDEFTQSRENEIFKETPHHVKVLKKCYWVLGKFLIQNPSNQASLERHIKSIFSEHLKRCDNIGVPVFLDALCKSNKNILSSRETVLLITRNLLMKSNTISVKDNHKGSYLELLATLTKQKDRIYKENQTIVITEMCSKAHNNIIMTHENSAELTALAKKFVADLEGGKVIKIPGEIEYFSALLYVMGIACEDKNNATESKAQSYFPMNHLLSLIDSVGMCYPLKKNLYFFIYHVYMDVERETAEEWRIFKILNDVSHILKVENLERCPTHLLDIG